MESTVVFLELQWLEEGLGGLEALGAHDDLVAVGERELPVL